MVNDELEGYFHPELRRVIRAATISGHPATKHLMENVRRYVEVFGYDADLEGKVSKTERSIFLGVAESGPLQGREIWLAADKLTAHFLAIGATGSGKSTEELGIAFQLKDLGIPVWAFDSKGGLMPLIHLGFLYVRLSDFPFNMLRSPKGVRGWPTIVSQGFAAALELGSVSQLLMVQTLNVVNEHVRAADPRKDAASLFELHTAFNKAVRDRSFKEQVEVNPLLRNANRSGGVMLGSLRNSVPYYNGVPLEALIDKNIIFDCRGLSRDEEHLIVGILSAGATAYLIHNQMFSEHLERFIIYDDMDEMLFRRVGVAGIDLFTEQHSKLRATGTGEGISSHSWIGMNQYPRIQNDSAAYLMFRMNNAIDAAAMLRAMHGDAEMMEEVLRLEPGMCIVKLAGMELPVEVRVPKPEIATKVTLDQIRQAEKKTEEFISRFDLMPVPEQERVFVYEQILREKYGSRSAEDVVEQKKELRENRIKEASEIVCQSPGITANELKGRLKWASSNAMFNEVVEEGLNQDILVAVKRYFTKREKSGRPAMRFSLSSKGYALIGKHAEGEGKGHIQRMFFRPVREVLERGELTVKGEGFADRADLYAYLPNGKLHFCIELSVSTSVDHDIKSLHRLLTVEAVPAVLVIVVHLTEERERKNVYVLNKKAEGNKAEALRNAVAREFPHDTRIVVKTFEEFRLDEG